MENGKWKMFEKQNSTNDLENRHNRIHPFIHSIISFEYPSILKTRYILI